MHTNNQTWLADMKKKYPKNFKKAKVLELGSWDYELHTRKFFDDCEYVGVDICEGYEPAHIEKRKEYGVDIMTKATQTVFEKEYFDTLICLSMFEHDSEWAASLIHNLPFVRKGGLILLCWGAEGNGQHGSNWRPVTTEEFHVISRDLPMNIVEEFFEESKYGLDCAGAYDVEAIKF